ncbi:unnamed protein product [Phyllotreta striolata]|uniref:Uncharacterized protein n=1 Tax=Phyllotreta striolata TaxID=444603 RepID=A0A9N9XT72_PHYSR|nr:unnamed protein product [Phyllotreta striolata]
MYIDFIAGWLGGMCGVAIGHPMDTIRLNLQTRNPTNPHYQSMASTAFHLVEKEGIRALFRGISSPLVGLGIMNSLLFGIYGSVLRMMDDPHSLVAINLGAMASAFGTAPICSPVELTKSRLQVAGARAGRNPLDCLMKLYYSEGVYNGVFKGFGLTLLREIPSNMSYFMSYEYLKGKETPSTLQLFNAGGMAGAISWIVPYPIDVIKSRMQVDGSRGPRKYKNWRDCLRKTIKREGYKGLYRGLTPTVVRAYPTNGVTFLSVDYILKHFNIRGPDDIS